jgi:ligand-binding SRPBCC domain-containing protein
MKTFLFERTQRLKMSPEMAWDFFSAPVNLPLITPAEMRFNITSELPERMYAGQIITYTVRPVMNLKVNWVTEITQVRAPEFFCDSQLIGPYRLWNHQHHFKPVDGGIEMRDIIHYAIPFGCIGRIANWLFVRKKLEYIFDFRKQYLADRFGELPGNK